MWYEDYGITKPYYGDEWICILKGDCREILPQLPDNSVDLVLTDPPYIIDMSDTFDGGRTYISTIKQTGLGEGYDLGILAEYMRLCRIPNIAIFCGKFQLRDYLNWAYNKDLKWALLTWHKLNPIPFVGNRYLPDTEYILHFWDGLAFGGSYNTKVSWYALPIEHNNLRHPTVKPILIVDNLILNATGSNGLILDPFLGSGTTAYCAKKLNRKCIGIEIEERYCSIAAKRCSQGVFNFSEGYR